jgi:predicted PhzF superfamily epimerase YddE/YHI9
MHCSLVDFWSKKLGKNRMVARQVSERGGTLTVEILGDRVKLSGKAILFATFEVDDSILF